jgi:hypothetical protein
MLWGSFFTLVNMIDLEKDVEYQLRLALSILTLFILHRTSIDVILHVFLVKTHHKPVRV